MEHICKNCALDDECIAPLTGNAPKGDDKADATQYDDVFSTLPPDDERIASALAQTQRDNVLDKAKNAFGIDYLFPWQRLVIANILDAAQHADDAIENCGKQIVLLPTGYGKSLCFLVPALLLDGCTLIIYPLLALMADQKRRIESGSLESVTFRGNQTREEREENFAKIKNGAKIIIANPEVLQNEALLARLCECRIAHIAIDEAHCVSEWGDSFRPAYLTLGKIIKKIHAPVVTAFTATASPHVLARVSEVLFDGEANIVRSEADRPNIHYHVLNSGCKKQTVLMLAHTEQRPMIVFCGTRLRAEDMTRELNVCYGNETARFYHAGMEKSEKDEIEKWFFPKSDAVLCATCAYGMGVDKKDIRTIIHLDAPQTAEQYIQEAGRSGRDGQDAKAILLWSSEDSKKFSQFAKGSREYAMKQFAQTDDCRRQVLLNALDAEQAVCSGCDLCDARKKAARAQPLRNIQTISDEEAALMFITAHRKMYSRIELAGKLLPLLNERAQKRCGKHTWDHGAVDELLRQLTIAGKIRVMKFPWNHKITVAKK
ncbi:MAG: ATP-dependent DNA helicase RecQ [Treponema sp.]|nr:ATP-dependent DNA helicase RecQ [Treponema sp.]